MSEEKTAEMRTLREWRETRGMTPMGLAYNAGVSLTTVLDIEQNRRYPNVHTALKLAAALGVSVGDVRWPDSHEIVRRPRKKALARVA